VSAAASTWTILSTDPDADLIARSSVDRRQRPVSLRLRYTRRVTRIVVIGGGLAGLTAAFGLCERCEVQLLEAGERLGGQIHTERSSGFVIERGGEGFVASSEAIPALARELGLADSELIGQAVQRSYGFDGRALRALAPGEAAALLGFQVPQAELGHGIRSFRRGMGSLIEALVDKLEGQAAIELGTKVAAIEPRGQLLAVHTASGRTLEADAVVVATSAAAAAPLLTSLAPLTAEAARALAEARTSSSVTVELAFAREQVEHALDGTGFVVALEAQREGLRACTFTSSKFSGRAPPGEVSLRAFLRPSAEELAALDEAAWIERALAGVARVLPLRAAPSRTWVSIWPHALPVFDDARRAAVAALEGALPPAVLLAGSAFHGSGIDAAVRSAVRTRAALLPKHA
jgi:oxygen-dependent protoporphyrinogen oxidase